MKRREAILGIALLAAVPQAPAQPARKVPRVGVLSPGTSKEAASVQREHFERGLRELGWVPGSTILVDYRFAEGNATRLAELAADFVRSGVDVIVARSPVAIHAARKASTTIPIVMSGGTDDPVADGLVKNLSRPGGNITGLVSPVFDLDGKRLELLKETLPTLTRVGVLSNPGTEAHLYEQRNAALQAGARSIKLQIQLLEVTRAEDLATALAAADQRRVEALLVRADRFVLDSHWGEIAEMAARHRLPAIGAFRFFVDRGGLMSYAPSLTALHYRSATYVDRILRGARPGDLAIEQPTKFELIVNLKAAKALGIEIPKAVLFRADEVIR